jgi:NAD(P)-dependent dehydrogenase (short-subunit alcohol dehydrogenase family)
MGLMNGRRVLVTGGTSGIGAATVQRLAAEGARGAVLDLAPSISRTSLPEGWDGIAVDVRDENSVRTAIARAQRDEPPLDALIPCAGIVPDWSSLGGLELAEFDDVMAVNARGVAATLKHAGPQVRDGGAIAVVGSLNSWRGDANLASYAASKHAVLGLVRSAALDFGRRGIRVNAVGPGPIATEAMLNRMRRRAKAGGPAVDDAVAQAAAVTATGRIATVQDVAAALLFLVSDLSGGISGHLIPVDGGLP